MAVKWVITEKIRDGVIKPRLIAQGFEETANLYKDSSTYSKETICITLSLIFSSVDIKATYSQIDESPTSNYICLWKLCLAWGSQTCSLQAIFVQPRGKHFHDHYFC